MAQQDLLVSGSSLSSISESLSFKLSHCFLASVLL